MKIYTQLFAILCLFTFSARAQENYTIKMAMRMEGLPPEMAAMGEMEITNYIKGDKLKSETLGMMGGRTLLIDGEKMTSLNDRMGNKTGYTATRAELDEADKIKNNPKPKLNYTSEKKTIAGYECTKVVVTTLREKEEMTSILWVTDKLNIKNNSLMRAQGGKDGLDLSELKGYPLAMEMNQSMNGQNLQMIMTATSVSAGPIDDAIFQLSTEGYRMMTYKEMMSRQSQTGPR
jgi:general stress protein 26